MPVTLRTKPSSWLSEVVAIFLLLVVAVGAMLIWRETRFVIGGILALCVFVPALWIESLKAIHCYVTISSTGISGRIEKVSFDQKWNAIKALSIRNDTHRLLIATDADALNLPIKYLNEKELEKLIKQYAPPAILEEKAYQTLERYQQWQNQAADFLNNLDRPLVVHHNKLEYILGWFLVFIGIILTALSLLMNQNAGLFFLVFSILGLFLIAFTHSTIEGDSNQISLRSIFGQHIIRWSEVKQVLTSPDAQAIVLVGENKRLVLPGYATWSGKDASQLANLFDAKAELVGATIKQSRRPLLMFSKNTRM